ncbi:MAG: TraB/GumN family protein [Parachlamydiaceae bacterium]|nr:MAG: TraB/GumN family protein [Parachlamydiaceae bacterium]
MQNRKSAPRRTKKMLSDLLSGVETFHLEEDQGTQYFENVIRRNFRMVQNSESYIEKGRTFVAVGEAHLTGKDGMINIYKSKGFTLKRVF